MAQLSLAAVALVVGLLLVGQLRSQAPTVALSALSAQELSDLIETLRTSNSQLSAQLAELDEQLDVYREQAIQGQSTLTLNREQVTRFATFAGLLAVEGQGIVLEVEGQLDPTNVNDLIHELRAVGAEAIAIDGVRITASSVAVRGTSGGIEIDGVAIGDPFTVTAIGSRDGLQNGLERPGGILSVFRQLDATWRISQEMDVTVPSTARDLDPEVAQPVNPVE